MTILLNLKLGISSCCLKKKTASSANCIIYRVTAGKGVYHQVVAVPYGRLHFESKDVTLKVCPRDIALLQQAVPAWQGSSGST